jgi:hypothetical protein
MKEAPVQNIGEQFSQKQNRQKYRAQGSGLRWSIDNLKDEWDKILLEINKLQLTNDPDVILWKFSNSGQFNVKSVYKALTSSDAGPYHKVIWKGKIPAKIKIFLWLIMNNAILTKDNTP